jgi:hypothetical protein
VMIVAEKVVTMIQRGERGRIAIISDDRCYASAGHPRATDSGVGVHANNRSTGNGTQLLHGCYVSRHP